ncbi:hypothetical protein AKL17_2p0016 (plasmid) [Frigidibacter mobilis]|uniref:Uncharacterized protein n=1 Tax=Frigidibacter mobilis TaxID=1335048 RepID=A0A159ZAY6_9RHOB|nr:hypothetical protein AKL17_2p0016 [Frigidibacter mobilis]
MAQKNGCRCPIWATNRHRNDNAECIFFVIALAGIAGRIHVERLHRRSLGELR